MNNIYENQENDHDNPRFNTVKIMELTERLKYRNSADLKRELVARNIMWHNEKMKRYEFTKEGIKQNFGKEIFVNKNYSTNPKPCNLFHVHQICEILKTDRVLPPHFGGLQRMVDYLF